MSETVHHFGKLQLVVKSKEESLEDLMSRLLKGYFGDKEMPIYYKNIKEWFCEELYNDFILYKENIYKITNQKLDADDDIVRASINEDGTISYELRYYNGGASFGECLEQALDKLPI